ncbi:hypothetical protein [Candidatus Magnetominusculus dajiuhuensis]|uniref:hypothetical protein n=1 Tax=Candidatus Magnetominusculus dajiuhuensis TaxID=3137712 RepID=UPI003B42C8B4
MIFNKKAIEIFGINCGGMSLREYGDRDVGDTFFSALTFIDIEMEPSESATKSLKKVEINLYEGVGRIFAIDKYDGYPVLIFDCGIYAFSLYRVLPKGIESGSYVKIRFYLVFDEDRHSQLSINGEPLWKVIPGMVYDWRVKDILIMIEEEIGRKNFAKMPVAYTSSKGEIYKRISGTNAYEDCGEDFNTSYILVCEML